MLGRERGNEKLKFKSNTQVEICRENSYVVVLTLNNKSRHLPSSKE